MHIVYQNGSGHIVGTTNRVSRNSIVGGQVMTNGGVTLYSHIGRKTTVMKLLLFKASEMLKDKCAASADSDLIYANWLFDPERADSYIGSFRTHPTWAKGAVVRKIISKLNRQVQDEMRADFKGLDFSGFSIRAHGRQPCGVFAGYQGYDIPLWASNSFDLYFKPTYRPTEKWHPVRGDS